MKHFWCTKNHEHTRTHKIHHRPDLGETTTNLFIIFFLVSHTGSTQMSFCPKNPTLCVLKLLKLRLLNLWRHVISYANLHFKLGLKQSCSLCHELSNDMWHVTCMHIIQGDSWLLAVGNQIGTLIPSLSFGHNLCYKYSNGSCEPILEI